MKNYLFILLLSLLTSCSNSPDYRYYLSDVPLKVVSKKGTPVALNETSFARRVICQGRYLVFYNRDRVDQCIAIYDLRTLQPLGYTGIKGEGPGELTSAGEILPHKDGFLMIDYGKYLLYYFNIKEALSSKKYLPQTVGSFRKTQIPANINMLNDSLYFGNNMLVLSGRDYQVDFVKGNLFTGEIEKKIQPNPKVNSLKLSACSCAPPHRYVVAYSQYYLLTFYNRSGEVIKEVYGEKELKKRPRHNYFGKPFWAGNDLFVGHQTGYSHVKDKRGRWKQTGAEEILHFDLEGNYIETIRLGCTISTFVVIPSSHQLLVHCIDGDNPFMLVSYEPVIK
ncbi:TolB-like 6-bladed beta-propeller domain-containing protein [Halosquirtibacter laminarini]|uniref:TolB-like 6-bladed beta-propeller domain-containing protein n=1 Tax=Halosquirtibacter laminarini TaxID=3374600 RepID=A0AC61NDM0_9BACT|nr:TolB-like 6-bladed beta-propeller domain-containing protein [Prolixibacteraceae bacterium]